MMPRCGKPKTSLIEMDNSELTLRLTDYNNYPHRHRSRFDDNGGITRQLKKIYKGEIKADNNHTKSIFENTPWSADALAAVFLQ